MKRIILTFGLISGVIISTLMLLAMAFQDVIGFDRGEIIGYTSMILAFLLIYFGVRSYRDNVAGGTVRFGRALAVGAGIALVSSLCYVATWEVMYFRFMPDYLDKYQAHMIERARANGESPAAIAQKKVEMEKLGVMYANPAVNAAFTFLEPLPVAVVVVPITAGLLSRKQKTGSRGELVGMSVPGST